MMMRGTIIVEENVVEDDVVGMGKGACGGEGNSSIMMFVDAQFPAGDVARSLDLQIGCSGYECCTKTKTIGSKRDRG
jgi:hypothetical protein